MNIDKKISLLIGLVTALTVYIVFQYYKLNVLSKRIEQLEHRPAVVEKSPVASFKESENDGIKNIYARISTLEEKVLLLKREAEMVVKPAVNKGESIEESEQRDFVKGREQWQTEHMGTLYIDSDKKAQLMVDYLSKNKLESKKQSQVFSILRDHFIEVAYVIADTNGYPTFREFTDQIEKLNETKKLRLSELLSEEELMKLNKVNWLNEFKNHKL